MATQAKPTVAIKLGGKTRQLKFTLNTFIEVEELTGMNLMERNSWSNLSLKTVRAFLYAAMKADDELVTITDVGNWIALANFAEVFNKFQEALQASLPQVVPNEVPLEPTPTSPPMILALTG